jgi:hypothetical protein
VQGTHLTGNLMLSLKLNLRKYIIIVKNKNILYTRNILTKINQLKSLNSVLSRYLKKLKNGLNEVDFEGLIEYLRAKNKKGRIFRPFLNSIFYKLVIVYQVIHLTPLCILKLLLTSK